ncbi:MBL fold metallo-hydrolase [Halobaculum sp. MBLA0147]|uniref:MBL fold metallo-hydrolase n=1 Tax=Halobaculum sp. MBLA0147 TaxID=3079934 RepID=UPI00352316E3
MRVTFLGTGAAMPHPERVQTGLLVEAAAGDARPLLVDCGAGILHRLSQTEPGYEAVSTVLLTHHHLDHVADLLPLVKARWLAGEEHLEIVGPTGTKELLDSELATHEYLDGRIDLTVREVSPGETVSVAGLAVDTYETRHSVQCLAYRFRAPDTARASDAEAPEEGGTPTGAQTGNHTGERSATSDAEGLSGESDAADGVTTEDVVPGAGERPGEFVFSGDSEAFEGLANFADGAQVLAHDCSFPDGIDVDNHPNPTQLGAALAGTDVERVYLTHQYPHTDGEEEAMIESVEAQFDGDVRVARDGLRFTV